jgi:site-specific DNA-methyltransferase (adenine-specific)
VTGKAKPVGRAGGRPQGPRAAIPNSEFRNPHFLAPSHFTLRDDGSIGFPPMEAGSSKMGDRGTPNSQLPSAKSGDPPSASFQLPTANLPRLVYHDDARRVWLYHGNSLELLDAIAAKYPDGRFDCIFADPPYFLSNGGITCHAGKMVKVDKGDWDVSRGPELNHEFNTEWLRRCQRVLKPNGTIWVTGTHHVIFSIGYALQQLGFKILNDIAWEKPNPPPNLSCRYFTHSTETVLWAAKNEKSKHVFNYQEMRKVTGKQMKTVWRKNEFNAETQRAQRTQSENEGGAGTPLPAAAPDADERRARSDAPHHDSPDSQPSTNNPQLSSVWTLSAPGTDEKSFGKHPTQKPVALVERCLLASTNEGDLVLDPFLGNGTTAVASLRLKRGCVGVELDLHHVEMAARRADREIIEIWLRHFRVRVEVTVFGGASVLTSRLNPCHPSPVTCHLQNDLDLFSNSINGSRRMAGVPEIPTERIFHECKFVFLACRAEAPACGAKAGLVPITSSTGAVVHTTVDVSLQEAWAKTPTGKKRETTHVVRCETEIFRVKS